MDEIIKGKFTINTIVYYNESGCFGILRGEITDIQQGDILNGMEITIKGSMPDPQLGMQYELIAHSVHDAKYGLQYQIDSMCLNMDLDGQDETAKRKFLESIYTEDQVECMYAALSDPFEALKTEDVKSLVSVKGCGFKTATRWIKRFNSHYDMAKIYVALRDYGITYPMIIKLQEHYKSSDIIIERVKKNPYLLIEVTGIGWKTCDKIARNKGLPEFCSERIQAYITFYLNDAAQNGYSYVPIDFASERQLNFLSKGNYTINLMDSIINAIGDDVPDQAISSALQEMGDILWWNTEHTVVGLKRYYDLEYKIATELLRIRNSENLFQYDDWEETVKKDEENENVEYTDQQIEAIGAALRNQVVVITGYAGTGKTTTVKEILKLLPNYEYAQVALAGRAANRMSEVTGKEGFTIHRLLGYPLGNPEDGNFMFTAENKLPYDIIILDEISMVDGFLFYSLIRAIKNGAKLIMLGDIGQLESIGCLNIAYDLIKSTDIASVQLDKIHRQAENSAIITESTKARKGIQLIPKDWAGKEIRGNMQDLEIECYSDSSNTFYKIMEHFTKAIGMVEDDNDLSIMDVQIIVPIKDKEAGTWNINAACQNIYNPPEQDKKEIDVKYDKQHYGTLRVGDKVINMSNNYKTQLYKRQWEIDKDEDDDENQTIIPIYNGSIGIIKDINTKRREMIIYFQGMGDILIKSDLIRNIQLAYAVTCHKEQGSEVLYSIIGLDFSAYTLLTKEWIYTALTRAIKHCTLIAQNKALRYAVSQNGVSVKQTHLVQILHDLANPVF